MQKASILTPTSPTQAGFVLENVHGHDHALCYELELAGCESSLTTFCIQCVIHALSAPTELKLSKRALFATLALVRFRPQFWFSME